ncbi:MAG: hypothetical protein O3C57_03610 [Verrucomicrobia bacterium]|nr:hypothetical protein [Verrucomicrobiota bacterium]
MTRLLCLTIGVSHPYSVSMMFKKEKNSLLEDAVQETEYRDRIRNHEITYVRDAIGRRLSRYLLWSVLISAILVMGLILRHGRATP